ncbi:MAG: YhcH/YjgK/YiaL family protein [Desulfuromonadales bacterium]|nr:YhcH/YjgK/YiaL family protein [Desulfuromonadales bacterium]
MVFDRLSNLSMYLPLHPQFAAVYAFLQSHRAEGLSPGRYEVDTQGAFALVSEYQTRPLEDCFIECHRRYIDIQLLLSGREAVGFCSRDAGRELPYDEEKDFLVLTGETDFLTFAPGSFAIFFPDDGHMPMIRLDDQAEAVKKVVFKIPVVPGV